jgi:cell division protein ZapA
MSGSSAAADADPAERMVTLEIALMGRDYKVACRESERGELVDAVSLLDLRMREIRDGGKIAGAERIAVMAALNLAHDLLRERRTGGGGASSPTAVDANASRRRIVSMNAEIESVMSEQDKLF